jgi:aryl-alcohol dehydrogenase-like predicted oxidoreductase
MKKVQLGQSDLHVTPICLGTMTFGEQVDEPTSHAILSRSLERGIDFIDTAEMYSVPTRKETFSVTETIIGNWFAKPTPARARSWCWPPRWRAPRATCPGCAKAPA